MSLTLYGEEILHTIVPPHQQPGLQADIEDLEFDGLFHDQVYNVELSWLAFNWRVLSMATLVCFLCVPALREIRRHVLCDFCNGIV